MGALLNGDLQILVWNEPPIDIMATPYQYLYSSVLEMAARARTKAAQGTKTKNCGLEEIDPIATNCSHKDLSEDDMTFLQTSQAGGGWSKRQLFDLGIADSMECDYCGEIHEGNDMSWCCTHPHFVAQRKLADEGLASLDPHSLPSAIKHGIAPALSHAANTSFWGVSIKDLGLEGDTRETIIGSRPPPVEAVEAAKIQKTVVGSELSATQLIATLRGGHGQGCTPLYPENVIGTISKKIMGYCDGGVKNPGSSAWQIAGFGIWWIDKVPEEENKAMAKYTYQYHQGEGSTMWANMAGQHAHSTRTEIAAVLIAMLRPVPLHLGSDSQAMIDKANFLMNAAVLWQLRMGTNHWTTKNPCKKPWSLQKDGDLWEQFWEASLIRGPRMLRLTKVKGHATLKDIVTGKSTEEHKKGSDMADTAATAGAGEGMPVLLEFANWLSDQH